MLVLREDEVDGLLPMDECIEAMRVAYKELGEERALEIPRGRIRYNPIVPGRNFYLNTMSGAVPSANVCAVRVGSVVRKDTGSDVPGPYLDDKFIGMILLFELDTGRWLATLPAFTISGIRVGATSAMVADALARQDATKVGIFGSGKQARTHLQAISLVRRVERVLAYSPTNNHLLSFCDEMSSLLNMVVEPSAPKDIVSNTEIILCATNSSVPLFEADWLQPGCHVMTIAGGDKFLPKREIDLETCDRADVIVFNSMEQVNIDLQPVEGRALSAGRERGIPVMELPELLLSETALRRNQSTVTLHCNNVGQGIQFAAVGRLVYERALKLGRGTHVSDDLFYTDVSDWAARGFYPST